MKDRILKQKKRWTAALLAAVLLLSAGCGRGAGGDQDAETVSGLTGGSAAEGAAVSVSAGISGGEDIPAASSVPDRDTDAGTAGSEIQAASFEKERKAREHAAAMLQSMSIEQKVAQMFVVTPDVLTGVEGTTICGDITKDALARLPVGGMIYMEDNLQNADQTRMLLQTTQAYSEEITGVPLLLFIDEEGGTETVLSGREGFPDMPKVSGIAVIGTGGDPALAREAGETIGGYLADLGFNADLAPSAEILGSGDMQGNTSGSFGSDPQMVAELAAAMGEGLESKGVAACYKHFPGGAAGGTWEDHASSNKTLEQLKACELLPFQRAIDSGAQMIMVSHMTLPNVIGYTTPASLSPYLLKNILREEMGFEGIILTDAMNAEVITGVYSPEAAAIQAAQAGADLILMPEDLWTAYTALVHAVREGRVRETDIDDAVGRILLVKARLSD